MMELAQWLWRRIKRAHRSSPFLWSDLATFGRMRFLQTMAVWLVLVPIAAKATEKLCESIEVFGTTIVVELPFSWYAFYFSAVAFTLANAVYQLRCPELIKLYYDFRAYRDSGQSYHYLVDYLRSEEMVDIATRSTKNVSRLVNYAGWQSGKSERLIGVQAWDDENVSLADYTSNVRLQEIDEQELFFYLHRMVQDYHPKWRQVCLALYAFGGLGLLWVSCESFSYVVRSLL